MAWGGGISLWKQATGPACVLWAAVINWGKPQGVSQDAFLKLYM